MEIKTQFSIKDLENLSNVKAHTIRIWEKRYNLLEPDRTDTNIRTYTLDNLKRLLNVTFLYNKGFKISKIANLNESEIHEEIQKHASVSPEELAIKSFKTAMFDFDHLLFTKTYKQLLQKRTFREVFFEVFIPLLSEIGILWQTESIDPAHERFISELIKQKIILNIENAQQNFRKENDRIFTLYLPYEEIHEIGLLYANYEIISAGFKTIYLGNNIPLDSLFHILKHHENITFLSYFTVQPQKKSIYEYVNEFQNMVCKAKPCKLWIMGQKTHKIDQKKMPESVRKIADFKQLILALETLKNS